MVITHIVYRHIHTDKQTNKNRTYDYTYLLIVVGEYTSRMKVKHIKVDIANKIVICLYVNTVSDTHNQKQPTTGKVFYFG